MDTFTPVTPSAAEALAPLLGLVAFLFSTLAYYRSRRRSSGASARRTSRIASGQSSRSCSRSGGSGCGRRSSASACGCGSRPTRSRSRRPSSWRSGGAHRLRPLLARRLGVPVRLELRLHRRARRASHGPVSQRGRFPRLDARPGRRAVRLRRPRGRLPRHVGAVRALAAAGASDGRVLRAGAGRGGQRRRQGQGRGHAATRADRAHRDPLRARPDLRPLFGRESAGRSSRSL